MSVASELIRSARAAAGITQAELAARAGMTQSAVARAEAPGSNPRTDTLETLLFAAGRRLGTEAGPALPDVDITQIRAMLRLTPRERLEHNRSALRSVRNLVARARWVDG